jgi:antirestriction protein ArdC
MSTFDTDSVGRRANAEHQTQQAEATELTRDDLFVLSAAAKAVVTYHHGDERLVAYIAATSGVPIEDTSRILSAAATADRLAAGEAGIAESLRETAASNSAVAEVL